MPIEMSTIYLSEAVALLVGNSSHIEHFNRSISSFKFALSLAWDKATIEGKLENYIYEEIHPVDGVEVQTAAYSHIFLCLCLIEVERLTRREQGNLAEVGKSQPERVIMAASKLSEIWATEQTRSPRLVYSAFVAKDIQYSSPIYLAKRLYEGKSIHMDKGVSAIANYLSLVLVSCLFVADYFSALFTHLSACRTISDGLKYYQDKLSNSLEKAIQEQTSSFTKLLSGNNKKMLEFEKEVNRFLALEPKIKSGKIRKAVTSLFPTIEKIKHMRHKE